MSLSGRFDLDMLRYIGFWCLQRLRYIIRRDADDLIIQVIIAYDSRSDSCRNAILNAMCPFNFKGALRVPCWF
jgi:hypothetical protein